MGIWEWGNGNGRTGIEGLGEWENRNGGLGMGEWEYGVEPFLRCHPRAHGLENGPHSPLSVSTVHLFRRQ